MTVDMRPARPGTSAPPWLAFGVGDLDYPAPCSRIHGRGVNRPRQSWSMRNTSAPAPRKGGLGLRSRHRRRLRKLAPVGEPAALDREPHGGRALAVGTGP